MKQVLKKIKLVFFTGRSSERPRYLEKQFLARYHFIARLCKNKHVLDLGTGLGEGAYYLAVNGTKSVLGIDNAKSAITYARHHFRIGQLHYQYGNVLKHLKLNRVFDIIVACELIEHLPQKQHEIFMKELKYHLKTNGKCIISTPNRLITSLNSTEPFNPDHQYEYTPDELLRFLKQHFSIVNLYGIKCINKQYLQIQRYLNNKLSYKLAGYISRIKFMRQLFDLLPGRLKQTITGESLLPKITHKDYLISKDDIINSEGLVAICEF